MKEDWRIIPGFDDRYAINTDGDVKRLLRVDSMRRLWPEKMIIASIDRAGYKKVMLRQKGKQNSFFLHRLLALTFIPNPENKPCINHKNSNRLDNSLSNLEWCSYSENNLHAHSQGNQKVYYGEEHAGSKLTKDQVLLIRSEYKPRIVTISYLSSKYSISRTVVFKIIHNNIWTR